MAAGRADLKCFPRFLGFWSAGLRDSAISPGSCRLGWYCPEHVTETQLHKIESQHTVIPSRTRRGRLIGVWRPFPLDTSGVLVE